MIKNWSGLIATGIRGMTDYGIRPLVAPAGQVQHLIVQDEHHRPG